MKFELGLGRKNSMVEVGKNRSGSKNGDENIAVKNFQDSLQINSAKLGSLSNISWSKLLIEQLSFGFAIKG